MGEEILLKIILEKEKWAEDLRVNQGPGTQWVSHTKDCDSAESPGLMPTSLGRLATVRVAGNIGMEKPGMTTGSAGTPRKLSKSGWNFPPTPRTSSPHDLAAYSHHHDVHHDASRHRLTTVQPGFTGFCSRWDPFWLPPSLPPARSFMAPPENLERATLEAPSASSTPRVSWRMFLLGAVAPGSGDSQPRHCQTDTGQDLWGKLERSSQPSTSSSTTKWGRYLP